MLILSYRKNHAPVFSLKIFIFVEVNAEFSCVVTVVWSRLCGEGRVVVAYFSFVNALTIFNARCHHWQPSLQSWWMTECIPWIKLIRQILRFWIVIEITKLKPKLNLLLKLWKGLVSPVIDVTVMKDSLLVYVLNFFRYFWSYLPVKTSFLFLFLQNLNRCWWEGKGNICNFWGEAAGG